VHGSLQLVDVSLLASNQGNLLPPFFSNCLLDAKEQMKSREIQQKSALSLSPRARVGDRRRGNSEEQSI
jgi:hypothetical protein